MTWLQAIFLGIIQGLTEFLPVSSSGHLVLTPYLLGWNIPEGDTFVFNVLVQIPSIIAVIVYFWRDLMEIAASWLRGLVQRRPLAEPGSRLGWLLILATIPAGLIGLLLEDAVEAAFNNPAQTGYELWITAGLLVIAERVGKRNRKVEQLGWLDSIFIGLAQAISIFPGVSRSGSTITGGMVRNLERPAATRFAFLMSIPIMLAAGLLASLDLAGRSDVASLLPIFLPGFIASGVVSYVSIRWLLRFVAKHSMMVFAIYCFILGSLVILLNLI
jgi:undecaprenyl-diphosphatase